MRWTLFSLIFAFLSFVGFSGIGFKSVSGDDFICREELGLYRCRGTVEKCIHRFNFCDGHEDCPFGEDEDGCSTTTDVTSSTVPSTVSTNVVTSSSTKSEKPSSTTTPSPTTTPTTEPITTRTTTITTTTTTIATSTKAKTDCVLNDDFRCKNNHCIRMFQRCNGNQDCADGSDEEACEICPKEKFRCQSSGGCIPSSWVCDGVRDCPNGQDENNCHVVNRCPENHLKCRNRHCVEEKYKCNGIDDCGDASDEENCQRPESTVMKCSSVQFRCHMGPCVPKELLCDGFRDCPHGDDEANCKEASSTCPPQFFRCLSEQSCIPIGWICDNENDCKDGSDEVDCTRSFMVGNENKKTTNFCKPTEFKCNSGECIDRRKLCDVHRDCEDGSDEHMFCEDCKHNNGGCQQFCSATPTGIECYCENGHRLSYDNQQCVDIDECAENVNMCDHFCNNTRGKYQCYCAPGYTLALDDRKCKLTSAEGFLLFSTGAEVLHLSLNGKQEDASFGQFLEVEKGDILGLDHNNVNHFTYYVNENSIFFAYEKPTCAVEGLHNGINVAIDWVTNNIYFADENPSKLGVCYYNGRYCTVFLLGDLDAVRGLALHPKRGIMLWTDWGDFPRIEKANMDGSMRDAIVTEKLSWPNAVTLDYVREMIYWADAKFQLIERCNLDGAYREVIVSKIVRHPFDMVVFMDHVFWSDWSNQAILSADLNDQVDTGVIHSLQGHPFGVSINHPFYHDRTLFNPCQNANCSHICALKAGIFSDAVTFSCLCPIGYTLLTNNVTCIPTSSNFESAPRWCLHEFSHACKHEHACQHGGVCRKTFDKNENVIKIQCECPNGYAGMYCETILDGVNWELLPNGHPKISKNSYDFLHTEKDSSGAVTTTTTIIVITFLVCFAFATVYVVRKVDFNGRRLKGFPWNPAVLFRRRLSSQREHFVHHEEGVNSKFDKAESFSNPVYEDVRQVPLNPAYLSFKQPSVVDCDNDSGLEFNLSHSSAASSPS